MVHRYSKGGRTMSAVVVEHKYARGCYKVKETVGQHQGVNLTITWSGLYSSVQSAIEAIEAEGLECRGVIRVVDREE